ncbi:glycosyltransferase family 2 protein [Aeromonas veronii]|uniref:glycosyltransferase family 2 protein n=1 Tax=Aeromonas dhakensis TaxID=196024 RepID=UPI002B48EEB5|nr:glycosyltransferase [Aeromonas dhakensis]
MKFDISVIIPTINRHDVLVNTLDDLNRQRDVNFEVVIIDQSANIPNHFVERLDSYNFNIRLFSQIELSASKARNVGLIKSKSDIVLFFDDDVIIKSDYLLKHHLTNYSDNSISGVFGQILLTDEITTDIRHKRSYSESYGWLFFPSNYTARVVQKGIGMAGNLSVRRQAAINAGGMDHNFEKGAYREESDFVQRFWSEGNQIVFDPMASLIHIGHKSGGIRSWGASRGLCAPHHLRGEWYFILNHGVKTNIVMNLYSLLRRQVINRINIKQPLNIPIALYLSIKEFKNAILINREKRNLKNKVISNNLFNDIELLYEKSIDHQ